MRDEKKPALAGLVRAGDAQTEAKEQFLTAFTFVKEYLVGRGSVTKDFDVAAFLNDGYLRQLLGDEYAQRRASVANPMTLTGFDDLCGLPVNDPAQRRTWRCRGAGARRGAERRFLQGRVRA